MRSLHWLALALVIIGALNWGLVGLFDFDAVAAFFGPMSGLSRAIYAMVGMSGIIVAVTSTTMERSVQRTRTRQPG